ncbi:MAG: 4-hydroxy-3-methylbut-2-enyl diphosphate reductase [Proteobacteria bacterium]|nr:4-hydroxy-3-methylbut-2-enyl diphosphate reductase [Pseudomonadota bacterium]
MADGKKIIVAKSAGFCWGVQRAFNKVLDVAKSPERGPVFTYGPLIHNPQAVEMLREQGIGVIDEISDRIEGTVAIRTHGVPPAERKRLEQSGASICDATCPDVGIIQGTVRRHLKLGYYIIIIGHREHPEVKALLGFAERRGACISSEEELKSLPDDLGKVCVVSQSTQQREKFERLVDLIRRRYRDCVVFDTICRSTDQRQQEVRELAGRVDAMVVVGGRNSSNTNRLAEISRSMGTPTFFIEDDTELVQGDFAGKSVIGVTAGASTPSWVIKKVVERLQEI